MLVFSERVPMVKGRWDPDGSTATSYAWFVWHLNRPDDSPTTLDWIPPRHRELLTRPDDAARFAAPDVAGSLPLFSDEGAGP